MALEGGIYENGKILKKRNKKLDQHMASFSSPGLPVLADEALLGGKVDYLKALPFHGHIRNITKNRKYIDDESAKIVIHAFVTIPYYMVFHNNLFQDCNLFKRQRLELLHVLGNLII